MRNAAQMIVELHLQSFAASERLSRSFKVTVCVIGRQQQQRAAGLLLSALRAADIELRAPATRSCRSIYPASARAQQQFMRVASC